MYSKKKKRKSNKHFYNQEKTLMKVRKVLLNLQSKLQKDHIHLKMQPHYESLKKNMATPVMQLQKINVSTLLTQIKMMMVKIKKLHLILILVCSVISMVLSMVVARTTSILLTHIIVRNSKPMVAIQILLLNNLVKIATHIRPNTQTQTISFQVKVVTAIMKQV